MKHADEKNQLSPAEQATVQELKGDAQQGPTIPLTAELVSWLTSLAGKDGPKQQAAAEKKGEAQAQAAPVAQQQENGESLPAAASDTKDAKEETISGSAFVKGAGDANEVDISDVQQGGLGDCYFLAVLASIARVRPQFIKDMIKDNGDGTYTVTFHTKQGFSGLFGSRSNEAVTVDSKFWTDGSGNPVYAKKGDSTAEGKPELWVMIVEKAWAKLHGGYGEITGGKVSDDARTAVTGKDPTYISPGDYSDAELATKLEEHFKKNLPVIFWSLKGEDGTKENAKLARNGVIGNHEYALNAAGGGKFTLYNPWGYQHLTDIDAAFIKTNFQRIRLLDL